MRRPVDASTLAQMGTAHRAKGDWRTAGRGTATQMSHTTEDRYTDSFSHLKFRQIGSPLRCLRA